MASQSQGIQQLLQAEKRAAEKVAEARKREGRRIEKETQEKMSVIQQNFQKNREVVLSQLLSLVCDIKPEIHVNYRING
ncbi:V-type proton ATPase subunit G 1 isoform X2 [Athene noctua]|uniref:V-type proton ATPase subunit G 1 isoform X2 n=1 Tax=Gymnogyps californianus TaxID=33616 RepID=UPI0021C5C2FE|nr:V-type proton ATPase subunit G 1 isoform X2 [Gymnogyps californianus]XP_059684852.1 V-type proton ATPase subunit G 1 isoform X2 [Gavia stellata]